MLARCALLFFLFLGLSSYAQQKYSLSGVVRNAATGETLIGALITFEPNQLATSSNSYGFYSLSAPAASYKVIVSYVGYEAKVIELSLQANKRLDVELLPLNNVLEEVVVAANKRRDPVRDPQMGLINLGMEEIKRMPVIFGEPDLLKAIQLLPGVQSAGEGSANFYVRGGGGDQNLILLDEATVYNASHLMGFFSTFNADAIKDVQLYKGGIPAHFGGRISSVLDIAMLDGNKKEFGAEGGVGLIASRLKVEGPIVKDKGSFMVSGRRTYADLFLKLSKDENANKSKLYFYDLNVKANYKLDDKNTLYLSSYFGKDELGYSDMFSFDWGNTTATLRWNHIINDRLFSNTSFIYSDFGYNVDVTSNNRNFNINSKIKNLNLKQDFSFFANAQHTLRFGLQALRQSISPASLKAGENAQVNNIDVDTRQGLELAAYASHEWKPSDKLALIYGLRLTDFMVLGPGTFYTFDRDGEVIAERSYGRQVIKHYLQVEPRFSASYLLNNRNSIKASYNRIAQNLHQLTNTTSSLPTDQYVVSSLSIKPQIANQVALGYFSSTKNKAYEFSMEGYYKFMDNQIDFKNGADLQANKLFEGDLLYGVGRSYGLEWYLRKSTGRLTGWISYTLSRSQRKFDEINKGEWFRARQDRVHDVSVVASYELSKRWTVAGSFVFNTGNAVTFPSGKYELDGNAKFYYTERNGYRMPNYHRLDLSATYEPKMKRSKYKSSWSFGVYNAYNRKNAYIIDFRENKTNKNITEAYQVALFGAIPSVTWNFKF